jgi:8-oxo-dGTP diphosphatase
MTDAPVPIAIAVVEHNDRFLIGQRQAGAMLAGYWEFPGGKIELGESPEEAAVRECREEAGVDVKSCGRYETNVEQYDYGAVRLYFIACQLLDSSQIPTAGFRWVSRRDLKHYEFPSGNRKLLETLLADAC